MGENEIDNPKCVYCDNETHKCGKHKDKRVYRCVKCKKYFTEGVKDNENKRLERHNLIKKLYIEDKLSTTQIGKKLGCSSTVIQRILKKYNITRNISEAKKGVKRSTKLPKDKIINMYLSGQSSVSIGKEIGCTKGSVLNILKENNIDRNNIYTYKHDKENLIVEMYLSGKSILEVSKNLDIPYTTTYSVLNKKNVIRHDNRYGINMSYEKYLESLSVIKKYYSDVLKVTKKQNIKFLPNYKNRCNTKDDCYHLDHKYSILEGFKNGIDPEIIGNINNLEFIPWKDNLTKKAKCSISVDELIKLYNTKNG